MHRFASRSCRLSPCCCDTLVERRQLLSLSSCVGWTLFSPLDRGTSTADLPRACSCNDVNIVVHIVHLLLCRSDDWQSCASRHHAFQSGAIPSMEGLQLPKVRICNTSISAIFRSIADIEHASNVYSGKSRAGNCGRTLR